MNVPETFFTVSEELRLFLLSLAAGAAVGLCWDLLRAVRRLLPKSSLLTGALDLLFLCGYGVFLPVFSCRDTPSIGWADSLRASATIPAVTLRAASGFFSTPPIYREPAGEFRPETAHGSSSADIYAHYEAFCVGVCTFM